MSPDLFGSAAPNPEPPKETKPAKPAVRSGAEPPAEYGASDIEILEGLDAGASYVAGNAFLLKAEAGKNAAAHSH